MAISKIAEYFIFKFAGTLEELRDEWNNRITSMPYYRKDVYYDKSHYPSKEYSTIKTRTNKYTGPITLHKDMTTAYSDAAKRTVTNKDNREELLFNYERNKLNNLHGIFSEGEYIRREEFKNSVPELTIRQREALNRIVGLHEMDEFDALNKTTKDKHYFTNFEHHTSPEVLLKEHNRFTTLPEDIKPKLTEYITKARAKERAIPLLSKWIPGYEHGISPEVDKDTINSINRLFKKVITRVYNAPTYTGPHKK